MTRKLKTPIGDFYLQYDHPMKIDCYCDLLDSNRKLITPIYNKENIKELKNIRSIGDIVQILSLENCTWGQSIEELTEEINDTYLNDPEFPDDNFTPEDMKNYMFLNKVGKTYFIINFEA